MESDKPHTDLHPESIPSDVSPSVLIQFCSDMHLEMPFEFKRIGQHLADCLDVSESRKVSDDREADHANVIPCVLETKGYLALLGDIVNGQKVRDGSYRDFLLRQSPGFEAVFVLAGNHEFYRAEYHTTRAALAALCTEVTDALGGSPVVHFLDCGRVDLPGTSIRVLGCTLWSHVADDSAEIVAQSLSDYKAISVVDTGQSTKRVATVVDTNAWHARELAWLERELLEAGSDGCSCVVLTHHAPSFHKTCAPEHEKSPIGAAFCTDLERMLKPPVVAWLFGHTHWSSWQRYRFPEQGEDDRQGESCDAGYGKGHWRDLSVNGTAPGEVIGIDTAEMNASAPCNVGTGEVLMASNQVGYGALGEHTRSRCHPLLMLEVAGNGSRVSLRRGQV